MPIQPAGLRRSWTPYPGSLCEVAPLAAFPATSPYPEEQALLASALPARRHESLAARALARQVLRRLGGAGQGIGRAASGAPCWPSGWTGSLSHGGGLAAALLGSAADWSALGVDIEPDAPLPEDAAALAFDALERQGLDRLPGGYARWSRAAFAAKECVHKCIHPLRGAWLEFDEIRVRFEPAKAAFHVEPLSSGAKAACTGLAAGALRFDQGYIIAALAIGRRAG